MPKATKSTALAKRSSGAVRIIYRNKKEKRKLRRRATAGSMIQKEIPEGIGAFAAGAYRAQNAARDPKVVNNEIMMAAIGLYLTGTGSAKRMAKGALVGAVDRWSESWNKQRLGLSNGNGVTIPVGAGPAGRQAVLNALSQGQAAAGGTGPTGTTP